MSFFIFSAVLLALQLQRLPVTAFAYSSRATSGALQPVAATYFIGWHAVPPKPFTLSTLSWDKYNTLIYAAAPTTPSVHEISLFGSDPPLLPDFVREAHEHGVAAHVLVGSYFGSVYFSTDVATPENRTAFVKTIIDFAKKYQLDGIDFDWEFPGSLADRSPCNIVSRHDTQNFLSFLQELRAHPVGGNLTLSAVAALKPFADASGKPSTNVTGFAEVLDYISIMDYDIWNASTGVVGPNSPLNGACAPPVYQVGSAVSAVKAWTAAGMPPHKIVLAVAAYGHSYRVYRSNAFVTGSMTELAPYPEFGASKPPKGDAWSLPAGIDNCGNLVGPESIYNLWGLVENRFLNTKGEPEFGIYYRFDNCSQTPYVYNETSKVMVSFDDARSFAAKGKYIKETGLRGFAMWEAGGDYDDILLNSIKRSTGF